MSEPAFVPGPNPTGTAKWKDRPWALVAIAGVVGAVVAIIAVVLALSLIVAEKSHDAADVAATGLVSIGAALAGGLAGWMSRGSVEDQDK